MTGKTGQSCPVVYGLCFGVRFVIEGCDEASVDRVNRMLQPWAHVVEAGPAKLWFHLPSEECSDARLDVFENDLQHAIACEPSSHTFIHAGVVAVNGSALLLPGTSFSGKSTLVTELVKAGATYYSDEFAVIDEAGRVHPFPRRPRLRMETGVMRPDSPSGAHRPPLEKTVTLSCRYEAGSLWRVKPLTAGEAFLKLMENTVRARTQIDQSMRVLGKLVRHTRAYSAVRGEACEAAPPILGLLHAG